MLPDGLKEYRAMGDERVAEIREMLTKEPAMLTREEAASLRSELRPEIVDGSSIDYYARALNDLDRIEICEELESHGFQPRSHRHVAPRYSSDSDGETELTPVPLVKTSVEALLAFADEEITEKRRGKLDLLVYALEKPYDIDENQAVRWFTEKDALDFDAFNEALFRSGTGLRLGKDEKVLDQTIEDYWAEIRDDPRLDYLGKFRKGLVFDLVKTMQGLALERDEQYKETVDAFERFFRRFDPQQYDALVATPHEYEARPVLKVPEAYNAAYHAGSCLANADYTEAHRMHVADPFTFIHAVGKDGSFEGYVRSFLLEDDEENTFLGVDTIEVPMKAGIDLDDIRKELEEKADIVQAGALAAIKLGVGLNVDYVAGRESRIAGGVRQAYGNTSREVTYRKPGDTVPYYAVAETMVEEEADIEVLAGDIDGLTRKEPRRVPAFGVYHAPGEQEVRGFQTEPGWHTHTVHVLYENPESFR